MLPGSQKVIWTAVEQPAPSGCEVALWTLPSCGRNRCFPAAEVSALTLRPTVLWVLSPAGCLLLELV